MQDNRQPKSRLRFAEGEQSEPVVPKRKPQYSKPIGTIADEGKGGRLRLSEDELGTSALEKPMKKVEKAAGKLEKARGRIPKKKAMAIARATDEATGKTVTRLHFEEQVKSPSHLMHDGLPSLSGEVHRQIGESEDENVGLKAAHGTEKSVESGVRFADHSIRAEKLNRYRAVEKAEKRLDKANIRVLQKKEGLSSNPISRWQQKRAIQKSYMATKPMTDAAGASTLHRTTSNVVQGVKNIFIQKKKSFVLGGLLFLMLSMVMNGLSSCTPMVQGMMQALVIATYPAEDADILAAEWWYREKEIALQDELNNYFYLHPEYDEYEFECDEIWHDPHVLISLISARMNDDWTVDNVYGFIDTLFERQYTLTQTIRSETRYRQEWVTHQERIVDPVTGEVTWRPYQVLEDVPYTYRTCVVKLENFDLSHLPFYVLSREGVGRYAMYISVHGNREDLFLGYPHAAPLREYTPHDIPEAYLEDETFARIIEEAEKYLGYPYVWGGDSPETSFDCSGFVSYVFTNSGVRNVGRLGATSLYGACAKITADQARPGDLIFFEGTIPGDTGISHVGIYVGDGWMIHCGKPVGYQRIDDSYYSQHFYGWGRLAR